MVVTIVSMGTVPSTRWLGSGVVGQCGEGLGWEMVGGLNEPVPEIDVVGLQLSQTLVNGFTNVVRLIRQDPGPVW